MVSPHGYAAFHERFAPQLCTHNYKEHKQAYGVGDDGKFASPSTENYPTRMNELIAEAFLASTRPAVEPLLEWGRLYELASRDATFA